MRVVAVIATGLMLAGCIAMPPDKAHEFTQQHWAKKSFDEARAKCRYDTMRHNKVWDYHSLDIPKFKACMERYGWRYNGG